jgi:hypothetical protein
MVPQILSPYHLTYVNARPLSGVISFDRRRKEVSVMTTRRRRFKQTTPLVERLRQFADDARAEASRLPDGEERDQLLKKAQVRDRAVEIERYLTSRELAPPS